MTNNFFNMLHLFSCGALGRSPNPNIQYDFAEIYKLSNQQQISTVVYLAVAELYKKGIKIDNDLYKKWEQQFFSRYIFSITRGHYLLDLIKKLDRENIESCVLKGDVLSALYKEPDSRVSSDIDLWIVDKKRIPEVIDIMKADGFIIHEINDKSHQIECTSSKYGLIELHTDFCDEIAKKIWFKDKVHLNKNSLIDISHRHGGVIHTLSYTDGAINITAHFIKHFLSHGCGCRQLMDTLMYLSNYKDEIDWDRYNTTLSELGFSKLMDICKKCGATYFRLDFEPPFEEEKELCDALLTDMEGAGIFGKGEEYRKSFFYAYTKKKTSSANGRFIFINERCVGAVKYLIKNKFNICKISADLRLRKYKKSNLQNIDKRLQLFENLDLY